MSKRKLSIGSTIVAAALMGAALSIAPLSSAQAGWRIHYHADTRTYSRSYTRSYTDAYYHSHHHPSYGYYQPYRAQPYGYANPEITQYVNAGVVSYPIYRVDHYKVDYASPYYVTNGGCGACGGW
jgi:hypothetical protein